MEKAYMDILWPLGLSTIKWADAETLPEVVFFLSRNDAGEQDGVGDQREAGRVLQTHFRGQRRRQSIYITCRRRRCRSLRGERPGGPPSPSLPVATHPDYGSRAGTSKARCINGNKESDCAEDEEGGQ